MGSNLTEVSTYSANVVGPDAGNFVTAASARVMGTALANRTKALVDGKWSTKSGVTSTVESSGTLQLDAGAALVSNGSAEFNGTGPNKTTIAELAVGDAGAVFTGPLTGQVGEMTWPVSPADRKFSAQENNGAVVSASCAFTMRRDFTVSQSIPTGAGGIDTSTLWVTPSVPWVLEGIVLQVTATCTSDADPGDVEFYVYVDGLLTVIVGTMTGIWGAGTTFLVDGTTSNKTIFGMDSAEKGTLLSPPFAFSGLDKRGLALDEVNVTVAALAGGDTFDLFGKAITLRVAHSSGSSRTLTLPLRLIAWGRLL